jgi:digeranylgeranylglycerophospholipid reductase
MKVDVLVVGAGPAGSCVSRELAESGTDVLAIDRRKEIGYPVQCGEFLPAPDELRRILPRSEEYGDIFDIEKSLIERETPSIVLFGPKGIRYEMDFRGLTLDRRTFDKSLWMKAEKAGAKLMKEVEFQGLSEPHTAETSAGEIEFKVLVGADGPLSKVRKSVGLPGPKALSQAVTAQATGDFDDEVKMYFGGIAPGGYAWIIPKRGRANVGLGIQKEFSAEPLSSIMRRFVEGFEMKISETAYGQVPVSGPVGRTSKGDAIIVGDAAGHVMATNGGGIPIAMICGRIAGRSIASALKGAGSISDYDKEWKRQILKPLANAARTKSLADLFFKTDRRLSFAMKVLRARGLERAILCKRPFYLF